MMEQILERENMLRAWQRVKANAGAPGIDGMSVEVFPAFSRQHWPRIRSALIEGTYRPAPVRRVFIPKPDGTQRPLGVPTVLDRVIQQALAQVLTPLFESGFSDHSYGFREGRSAHQALRHVEACWKEGRRYVTGWLNYFGISETYSQVVELSEWVRRRVRLYYWKQWKQPRTRRRHLLALGIPRMGRRRIGDPRKCHISHQHRGSLHPLARHWKLRGMSNAWSFSRIRPEP